MTREPIYQGILAFFTALTAGGSPAFKVATRKMKHWEDVPPEDTPALLLLERTENSQRPKGLPTKWTGYVDLYLYANTGASNDPDVVPMQIINPLLDAIEASLTVDDPFNSACTLGGLVSHCAIEGDIQKFPGSMGDDAVVIVPIAFVAAP